jgi:hypothetical protein
MAMVSLLSLVEAGLSFVKGTDVGRRSRPVASCVVRKESLLLLRGRACSVVPHVVDVSLSALAAVAGGHARGKQPLGLDLKPGVTQARCHLVRLTTVDMDLHRVAARKRSTRFVRGSG